MNNELSSMGVFIVGTSGRSYRLTEDGRIDDSTFITTDALPLTADGVAVLPGMLVYCIVGTHVDERKVIGPYGSQALLTFEPARHGAGAGSTHRLASTVYASREAAVAAISTRSE